MMKEIPLKSWEQFEENLHALRSPESDWYEHGQLKNCELLFRGHQNANWSLSSTLERRLKNNQRDLNHFSFYAYFRIVSVIQSHIESFTGRSWDVPQLAEMCDWLKNRNEATFFNIPGYDYLIYLRHHGFPSPLLDWTESPYVAAFFAFSEATEGLVSIYAFLERTGNGKTGIAGKPVIFTTGPYVRTHARHFLQQSRYSACVCREDDRDWTFHSHEDVFRQENRRQDLLWKFTLPSSERAKVLRRLNDHNLNAYSLFQSEEALLETLATREIDFLATSGDDGGS